VTYCRKKYIKINKIKIRNTDIRCASRFAAMARMCSSGGLARVRFAVGQIRRE
jgi:hypothetical protein